MKFVISYVVAHSSRLLPGAVAPGDKRYYDLALSYFRFYLIETKKLKNRRISLFLF